MSWCSICHIHQLLKSTKTQHKQSTIQQPGKWQIFSTPRPLFYGIMFLTACDVDFILKCEWKHISGGSMWDVYLSKTKVHHEMRHSIHHVCHTLSCVHRKKLFEFLKYNNICSLTAILDESISKYSGYPRNMHKFEERWKLCPVTSHS
jgi:hypothetical protein